MFRRLLIISQTIQIQFYRIRNYIHSMKSFLILLSSLIALALHGQNTIGVLSIDQNLAQEGYNLLYPHNQSNVYLLDNCGEIVHLWEDEGTRPGNSAYILENGDLIKCKRLNTNPGDDPIWAGGGGAYIEIRDWENQLKYSFFQNDSLARIHHDIAPMPNGNILAISWELIGLDEMLEAGVDTSKIAVEKFWSDYVFELNPSTDEIVWEWHAWDHLVQEFDPLKSNFFPVYQSPERIHVNFNEHTNTPDWLHSNSIDYNPVLDQIVISVPHFNEFWIIDHSTTTAEAKTSSGGNANRGGDLLYRWGNPQAYNFQQGVDQRLFFQHDVHWIDPYAQPEDEDFGILLMYNNRIEPESQTAFFDTNFDYQNQKYPVLDSLENQRSFDKIITHPESVEMASSQSVSSAQLLENGNTLVCAGRWGYSFEITPEDDIVWEYRVPVIGGAPVAQGTELEMGQNFTFRMKRYARDFSGFENRDLSPKGYLELSPNEDFCMIDVAVDEQDSDFLFRLSPNPTTHVINIDSETKIRKIQILDINGKVIDQLESNFEIQRVDVGQLKSGFYFLRINENKLTKFVKL